jgi:hypothetical protein
MGRYFGLDFGGFGLLFLNILFLLHVIAILLKKSYLPHLHLLLVLVDLLIFELRLIVFQLGLLLLMPALILLIFDHFRFIVAILV